MITEQEARSYGDGYKIVPIYTEVLADISTPIEVLKALKTVSHHCYILESVENQEKWGRFTYLGYDPKLEISCVDGVVTIKKQNNTTQVIKKNPRDCIKEVLMEYTTPKIEGLPSFTGGLVGYFAYDFAKYEEHKLNLSANDEEGFKDVDLMLFDKVIAFDNLKQKIYIIANAKIKNFKDEYIRCVNEIRNMEKLIRSKVQCDEQLGKLTSKMTPLYSKAEYCDMVEKAKKYIYEGDIFQVVLSNRLHANFEGSLLNTYRLLRTINPSPYMFYFSSDDMEVAGASPETLVKLENGVLNTYPIAGTRPRGKDSAEDERLKKELLEDEKELAEHTMLVDLGRNDLGKISEFGSVEVERYKEVQKFSHVMHICSTVTSKIRSDKNSLDAINSVLPAGTLSGAPKIRAMEIINELENNKRGIYGGAIGYIGFTGNMDTCIGIRLAYKKNGKVFVRSGAGIVADSVPENEYQECINKAKAVMEAVESGQVNLDKEGLYDTTN